jgi:hypothetical protein
MPILSYGGGGNNLSFHVEGIETSHATLLYQNIYALSSWTYSEYK